VSLCLQTLYGELTPSDRIRPDDRWAVCVQAFGTEHDHNLTIPQAVARGHAEWLDERGCFDCRDVTEDEDRLVCSNCDRRF
jgi:hypothetical protein